MIREVADKQRCPSRVSLPHKTRIRLVVCGLIVALACPVICLLWFTGEVVRIKPFVDVRQLQLEAWWNLVKRYTSENGKLPDSLYEAALLEEDAYVYPYVTAEFPSLDEYDALMANHELFLEKVQYELVRRKNGWFIIELESDEYYPYILMIEQDGTVYTLRKPSLFLLTK